MKIPVAAAELREAASGDEVLVNPAHSMYLKHRVEWFCGRFAAERGLVLLVCCYVKPHAVDG
jgi:hypothetical protein